MGKAFMSELLVIVERQKWATHGGIPPKVIYKKNIVLQMPFDIIIGMILYHHLRGITYLIESGCHLLVFRILSSWQK